MTQPPPSDPVPTAGPAETMASPQEPAAGRMPALGSAHRVDPDPPALPRDGVAVWWLSAVVLGIVISVVAGWFTESSRWAGGLLAAVVVLVVIMTRPAGALSRSGLGPTPLGRLATAICGAGFIAGSVWVSAPGSSLPAMLTTIAALWLMTVLLGWRSLPPNTTLAMVAGGSALVLCGVAGVLGGVGRLVEGRSLAGAAVVLGGVAAVVVGVGFVAERWPLFFGAASILGGVAAVVLGVGSLVEGRSLAGVAFILVGVAFVVLSLGLPAGRLSLAGAASVLLGVAVVVLGVELLVGRWPFLFGVAFVLVGVALVVLGVGLLVGRWSLLGVAVVLGGVAVVVLGVELLVERWSLLFGVAVVLVGVAGVLVGVELLAAGRAGLSWSRLVRWWTRRLDDPGPPASGGSAVSGDPAEADQDTVAADTEAGPLGTALDADPDRINPGRADPEDER